MFDIKEIELMFADPLDLLINNLNSSLFKNKLLKIIFS